ncbi:14073_t:CDS:10, partial [Cetraspora pellucida]
MLSFLKSKCRGSIASYITYPLIMFTQNFSLFLDNVIAKPEIFQQKNQSAYVEALNITKDLYDLGKNEERKEQIQWQEIIDNDPVEELVIDKLSNEQIWDEIDRQNNPFLKYVNDELDALDNFIGKQENDENDNDSVFNDSNDDSLENELSDNNSMDIEDELFEENVQDNEDENDSDNDENENDSDNEEDENDSDNDEDENDSDNEVSNKVNNGLNDEFFNLEEFNKSTGDDNNMLEDDEIDYFADPDELDDESNANDIMYKDFFDPLPKKTKKKKQKLSSDNLIDNLEVDNSKDDYGDDNESLNNLVYDLFAKDTSDDKGDKVLKSPFHKKQEKVQKRIEQLEMENVADKDWTLMGEVSNKHRPLNSLLEEDLKFDHIVKPAPVITEEVTVKLEDMIKQRILDETFDDVERKQDPNFRPFLPSKLVEVSDEKSKKSLAEIYEESYIKQTSDMPDEKDDALKKEHQEIENMFKELCHKLDALSNFHYTPKPPRPEISVIADVPAIAMEEIIPVHVSDGTLLAPEEVYDKKKQEVKGDTEMDSNEKKRARAAKKRLKKKEKKLKEREKKVVEKLKPEIKILGIGQNAIDHLVSNESWTREQACKTENVGFADRPKECDYYWKRWDENFCFKTKKTRNQYQ